MRFKIVITLIGVLVSIVLAASWAKVTVHVPVKSAAESTVKWALPGGITRRVSPVHNESDRGRTPILGEESNSVALKGRGERMRTKHSLKSCPYPLATDTSRAARVQGLLRGTQRGRRLLEKVESLFVCFDAVDAGVLRNDGIFVLTAAASDSDNASRLGHLLLHKIENAPYAKSVKSNTDCKTYAGMAVEAEIRAHELEIKLRQELGLNSAPLLDADSWQKVFYARCEREKRAHND